MFFVAIRFSDEKIARLFDLARVVLQPDFARTSHITLRGPYSSKSNISAGIIGRDVGKITVGRPGTFFSDTQSTVFLHIDILGIADFWHKPDYPNGTPHLTIYDGKNKMLAWAILRALKNFKWKFSINSTTMQILEIKQPLETDFIFKSDAYRDTLSLIDKSNLTAEKIKKMNDIDRIIVFNKICSFIHILAKPTSSPY